eukprot:TRINITY_DN1920_c0_g1_i1.p2 TRINITY_DN1920_c0_g1~~TRINITY_DN1920_c0_g1_i1.p2  ORF type:complete len:138 (-),score=55.22 TRINITY_DN1920_c0_g1_i1:46-459(-)
MAIRRLWNISTGTMVKTNNPMALLHRRARASLAKIERQRDGSYVQSAGIVGKAQNVSMAVQKWKPTEVFEDAYIVMEHQPTFCSELSVDNAIVYDNIVVQWVGGHHAAPVWEAHKHAPACNSTTHVDGHAVKITWNS